MLLDDRNSILDVAPLKQTKDSCGKEPALTTRDCGSILSYRCKGFWLGRVADTGMLLASWEWTHCGKGDNLTYETSRLYGPHTHCPSLTCLAISTVSAISTALTGHQCAPLPPHYTKSQSASIFPSPNPPSRSSCLPPPPNSHCPLLVITCPHTRTPPYNIFPQPRALAIPPPPPPHRTHYLLFPPHRNPITSFTFTSSPLLFLPRLLIPAIVGAIS